MVYVQVSGLMVKTPMDRHLQTLGDPQDDTERFACL